MKKISFVFLFFSLFLLINMFAFANSFSDLDPSHINYNAIMFLKEKGIVEGFSDGSFRPDNNINRAEAIKVIVEAFDIPDSVFIDGHFSDVRQTDWFAKYVFAGKNSGIISGYTDSTFRPGNHLINAEALKIVLEGAKVDIPSSVDQVVFSDVSPQDWFSTYSYFAREKNVILADDLGRMNPRQNISRGEFCEFIFRTMKIKESGGKSFDLATNWPEFKNHLGFSMKYNSFRWRVREEKNSVTFYYPDLKFDNLSSQKVLKDSSKITVFLDRNESKKSSSEYFTNLKEAFPKHNFKEFQLNGLSALELVYSQNRTVDWYIYTPQGNVLAVFTEYGDGILAFQFPKEISAMLNTLSVFDAMETSSSFNKDDVLSNILSNILIKNKGLESINMLPDKAIIETDTIGVGTGPVDYYYSQIFDFTLKYERVNDLILDKRDGRNTAF